MWMKAIACKDSVYLLQYAFRRAADEASTREAIGFLKNPLVCDSRGKEHPCPKGM